MYYVVRNDLGEKTIIYPWRNGFMFVQPKHGYLPKPQSKSKTVERKWYKDDEYFHTRCRTTLGFCSANLNWFLRDGYWWEKVEIKPKVFPTTIGVSVVKFDNVSLKDAIGSCFCEMDAYINTYPEAFIIYKGVETPLNMEANNDFEDDIVEYLKQLPNGIAVALCVSFIADTIYPDEDEDSVNKSLMFVDEVFEIITKHRREANDEQ